MSDVLNMKKRFPSWAVTRATALALAAAPYLTPAKLLNLMHCEIEKRRRVIRPRSFPYIAIIDITNSCNLRCPYCPTGERRKSGRETAMVDPASVQRLISEMGRYLLSANLFNWGEPLLHPEIASIVKMFHDAGVFTMISTNLNIYRNGLYEDLCNAGLDYVMVSLSGVTQETYEQYHRHGHMDRVIENTRRLIDCKRKMKTARPVVEWKYLVFNHNVHEVDAAKRLSRQIGTDIFREVRAGGPEESRVREGRAPERNVPVGFCHHLWHSAVLNADGGVPPCCFLFFKDDDFGSHSREDFLQIRNNDLFVTARKLFQPSSVEHLPPDMEHPCLKCEIVHRQPHLVDYLSANPHAVKGHRTGGP